MKALTLAVSVEVEEVITSKRFSKTAKHLSEDIIMSTTLRSWKV